MDDIGNLVYVLLILMFAAFQIFAAAKKKKDRQGGEGSEPEGNPWDDIFGEKGEAEGQQPTETPTAERQREQHQPVDEPYDPARDFADYQEDSSQPKEQSTASPESQRTQTVNEYLEYMREKDRKAKADRKATKERQKPSKAPELEIIRDSGKQRFNLRQAVIQSAILERKYR